MAGQLIPMETAKRYVVRFVQGETFQMISKFKKALILLFIISIIGFLYWLFVGTGDISSAIYRTKDDALKARAVGEHKWLPHNIPDGALNIYEVHDIDTNEVFFSFYLEAGVGALPIDCMSSAGSLKFPYKSARNMRVPEIVPRQIDNVDYLKCSGSSYDYGMIFDRESNKAYGWSIGRL